MGIYSETLSNTPDEDDFFDDQTNCYNCDEDCIGVWLQYLVPEGDQV